MGSIAKSKTVGVFSMQIGMHVNTLLPFLDLLTFFHFPTKNGEKKKKYTMETNKHKSRHKNRKLK